MTRERLKSPRARLFVALDLPTGVLARLEEWGEAALADPALRPAAPPLHVTLAFLGWMPEKAIPEVAELVHMTRAPAPRLRFRPQPLPLPPRGRPRLFALDAPSAEAEALQDELQRQLVAARLFEPERRPFWSHVTVARVRSERLEGRRRGGPQRVERPPGRLPAELCEAFGAVRVTLYRSTVRRVGAEYVPLAQVELPEGQQ